MLGAGAAAHTLAPLLLACGGDQSRRARFGGNPQRPLDQINDQVRAAVARLSQHFGSATGYVVRSRLGRAVVDETEKQVDTNTHTSLVFRAETTAGLLERATTDLSDTGINLAELQLRQRATNPMAAIEPRRQVAVATQQFTAPMKIDPRSKTPQDWLAQLETLFQRARKAGDSRIVYRGAYALIDDRESVFVTPDSERSQRLVRTHTGVSFVAWTGNRPVVDEANRAGTMGLEAMQIDAPELAAAARRALSLLTARRARDFDGQVILGPSVVAMLARECLGPALAADRWASGELDARKRLGKRIGSAMVNVIDDPTLPGFFGSYFVDDEGQKARRTTLIKDGILLGPVTDLLSARTMKLPHTANGRRLTQLDPARPHFSNLWFAPGPRTRQQLIESVSRGVLVEGGVRAQFDPQTWRLVLRGQRALEIIDGRLTGKLFAGVDVVSDLPALLNAVTGMSDKVEYRVAATGVPTTAGGPHMLTRAKLVGRG